MPPKFARDDNEQMPNPERKPPDRLEAQDPPEEESKIGAARERSDNGKQKDPAYEIWRNLSEEFATAARLYAEVVAAFAASPLTAPRDEYNRLRKAAEEALGRSEAMGIAFEKHVELHRSQMPLGVGPQSRFNLAPQKLLHVRAALFRQIEIADKLARELTMPELRALLADMAEEVRRVFQPNP
jgi:hypothetical protein